MQSINCMLVDLQFPSKRGAWGCGCFWSRMGGELPLPKRKGRGSYYVDWILARLDGSGELTEFTAIEVQTIDTTGSYQNARRALIERHEVEKDTVGLNWENVSKRIIPQIIYKGRCFSAKSFVEAVYILYVPSLYMIGT